VFERWCHISETVTLNGIPWRVHDGLPQDDHRWIPQEYLRNDGLEVVREMTVKAL